MVGSLGFGFQFRFGFGFEWVALVVGGVIRLLGGGCGGQCVRLLGFGCGWLKEMGKDQSFFFGERVETEIREER